MNIVDVRVDLIARKLVGNTPEHAALLTIRVAKAQVAVFVAAEQNERAAVSATRHVDSPLLSIIELGSESKADRHAEA